MGHETQCFTNHFLLVRVEYLQHIWMENKKYPSCSDNKHFKYHKCVSLCHQEATWINNTRVELSVLPEICHICCQWSAMEQERDWSALCPVDKITVNSAYIYLLRSAPHKQNKSPFTYTTKVLHVLFQLCLQREVRFGERSFYKTGFPNMC